MFYYCCKNLKEERFLDFNQTRKIVPTKLSSLCTVYIICVCIFLLLTFTWLYITLNHFFHWICSQRVQVLSRHNLNSSLSWNFSYMIKFAFSDLTTVKYTLKLSTIFKTSNKSVWSNVFWYVKVCIFWKCIQYPMHLR